MSEKQSKEVAVRDGEKLSGVPSMEQWRLMREMATELLKSGFLPDTIKTAEQAVAIILAGKELGLPPMLSLRLINVIKGKPSMSSEGMAGLVFDRIPGARLDLIESTEDVATYTAQRPGGEPVTLSFTYEEAARIKVKTQGVWKSLVEGLNWKNYRAAMLRARCCSAICRIVFPDVTLKIYTPEELGADVNAKGEFVQLPEDAGTTIDTSLEDDAAKPKTTHHFPEMNTNMMDDQYDEPLETEAEPLPPEPDEATDESDGPLVDANTIGRMHESKWLDDYDPAKVAACLHEIRPDLETVDDWVGQPRSEFKAFVDLVCQQEKLPGKKKAASGGKRERPKHTPGDPCPKCGSPTRAKDGKYGAFVGCTSYPKCKFTADVKE